MASSKAETIETIGINQAISQKTEELLEEFKKTNTLDIGVLTDTDDPEELFGWLNKFKDLPANTKIILICGCEFSYHPPIILDWYDMPFVYGGFGMTGNLIFSIIDSKTEEAQSKIVIPKIFFISFVVHLREYCDKNNIPWTRYRSYIYKK